MYVRALSWIFISLAVFMTGCASVPMASVEEDLALKKFETPNEGKSGVYVYRDSFVGQLLKKSLFLDGAYIGESANKTFFYKEVEAGDHVLSTESEFSNNDLQFTAVAGKNYFFEQYIKMGVFVGGADLKEVPEFQGMKSVNDCQLAVTQ